jgi:hypothetical protein
MGRFCGNCLETLHKHSHHRYLPLVSPAADGGADNNKTTTDMTVRAPTATDLCLSLFRHLTILLRSTVSEDKGPPQRRVS